MLSTVSLSFVIPFLAIGNNVLAKNFFLKVKATTSICANHFIRQEHINNEVWNTILELQRILKIDIVFIYIHRYI